MGTPPKPSDPSEVLSTRRDEALKGGSADMLYVEFSVDKDANSDDRRQWAVANPSYPHRTGESAILRMKKNLGDDSLRREGLGIWDETTVSSSIDPRLWANGTVETRADGGVISFCIDMSPDRSSGHRRAKPRDGAAVRTEVTRHEGHGEHHQRHGPGVRLRIGHADRRHAEASIRCGSAPIGHGGGERDHKADWQKQRVRLEQDGIRHRHLAIDSLHDGIAGSVDHTTQSEQMAARHALEGEDYDMTDEGIWSAAVKRPLDVNSLNVAGIDGVVDEDMPMIGALCKVWRDCYPYNLIRQHTRLPFPPEA
ncbi:hypothetical protein [Bifidobacterium pseudocatenulatum]|uniref:hypothetical protein n=2 Tax=Bifidobacterium TaxID=1678 RepID=UPI00216AF83F|nr:hypothetical protein [Bifidobacterium pseudocatenulatum]